MQVGLVFKITLPAQEPGQVVLVLLDADGPPGGRPYPEAAALPVWARDICGCRLSVSGLGAAEA
jgi:hypothetical protein